jgi:hypothetical protein
MVGFTDYALVVVHREMSMWKIRGTIAQRDLLYSPGVCVLDWKIRGTIAQ